MDRYSVEYMTATCSCTMHNRGAMAKSVAVLCYCYLFKVDARHEYKW